MHAKQVAGGKAHRDSHTHFVAAMDATVAAAPGHDKEIAEFSACCIAPALMGFVAWVHKVASAHEPECIVFLARDGQLPRAIYDTIPDKFGPKVESTYAFASRSSWVTPVFTCLLDRGEFARASRYVRGTPRYALELLRAPKSDWHLLLKGLSHTNNIEEWLSGLTQNMRSTNYDHTNLMTQAVTKSEIQLDHLKRYLFEEQGFHKKRMLMIDIGWRGSLEQAVHDLSFLEGLPQPKVSGAYMALRAAKHRTIDAKRESWSASDPFFRNVLLSQANMVEVITRSDHPTTIDFDLKSGRCIPNFGPALNAESAAFISAVHQYVLQTSETFWNAVPPAQFESALYSLEQIGRKTLERVLLRPTAQESKTFDAQPHSAAIGHEAAIEVAPQLSLLDCLAYVFSDRLSSGRSHWPAASVRKSLPGHLSAPINRFIYLRRWVTSKLGKQAGEL